MYKLPAFLFLVSALGAEESRKHHRKHHHKHAHGHHSHHKDPTDPHKVSSVKSSSNHTNVVKIPPTDAINAHNVATKAVPAHSVDGNKHAQSALKKGQKEARADSGSLSEKELLNKVEKLREHMNALEAKRNEPDTGTLVHEVPPQRELPRRKGAVSMSAESADESDSSVGVSVPSAPEEDAEGTPYTEKGIDIDTAMPYGELEPFGREDTAQELTEDSIQESDEMVDQLERAEVAEEKRAVFRALTRLRGAAITSFDGIARSQTGNIDEYNKLHKWRRTHPLHHLADEESDISKWAFPDNADF